MKTIITLAAAIGICGSTCAENYEYLSFQKTDGTRISLSVNKLELTFENGMLKTSNEDGDNSFPLSELNKMFFTVEPTAIRDIASETDGEEVELFTPEGIHLGHFSSAKEAQEKAGKGLYILKGKSSTIKISKP
ncbi:MAG: hypothetical protein ACI4B3_04990 [Prevotella sp.]